MEGPVILEATLDDAQAILDLQKLAYQSEALLYNDYDIAPLKQTLEEMETDLAKMFVLKAVLDDGIVGSIRGREKDGTCFVGRLIVQPEVQGRGIGTGLLKALENHFVRSARFELFTGHRSEKNLYLYNKLGYQKFREQKINDRLTMVFLEKKK